MPKPRAMLPMAAGLLLVAAAMMDAPIRGAAEVKDGDTLKIGDVSLRLSGIDAPELAQRCGAISCGIEARAALQRLTHGHIVVCQIETHDKYGRAVGKCEVDGVDIAAAMTRSGHALAYRQYSHAYVMQELEAELEGAGIWASDFMPPWEWRRAQRQARASRIDPG